MHTYTFHPSHARALIHIHPFTSIHVKHTKTTQAESYQFTDTRAEETDPETQRFDYVFTTGGKVRIYSVFLVWWIGGVVVCGG